MSIDTHSIVIGLSHVERFKKLGPVGNEDRTSNDVGKEQLIFSGEVAAVRHAPPRLCQTCDRFTVAHTAEWTARSFLHQLL